MQTAQTEAQQASTASSHRARKASREQGGSEALHPLLYLQQTAGNRAVGRMLQAKLKVNEPGDEYEQEADRVAESVMRMPEPPNLAHASPVGVQKKCAACASGHGVCPKCAEEEKMVQRKPLISRITSFIQRQVIKANEKAGEAVAVQRQPASSGRKEQRRVAFLKELAKWPSKAHQQWKRLEFAERMAVLEHMGRSYGRDFATKFLQHTTSPTLEDIHYGPGFPEHTPQWFQMRGYRLAQTGGVWIGLLSGGCIRQGR